MRSSNSLLAVLCTLATKGDASIYDDTGIGPRGWPSPELPVDANTCPCLVSTPTVTATAVVTVTEPAPCGPSGPGGSGSPGDPGRPGRPGGPGDPWNWNGRSIPVSTETVYASGGKYISLPTVTVTASYTTTTTIVDPAVVVTHTIFANEQHLNYAAPSVTVTATTVVTSVSHAAHVVTVTQFISAPSGGPINTAPTASGSLVDPGAHFDHHHTLPFPHGHPDWQHESGWGVLPEATRAPSVPSNAPFNSNNAPSNSSSAHSNPTNATFNPKNDPSDPVSAPFDPSNPAQTIEPPLGTHSQDPDWHRRYTQTTWPVGWPTSLPVPSGVHSCDSNGWCYNSESRPIVSLPYTLPVRPAVSGNTPDPGVCGISYATVTVSDVVTKTVQPAEPTGPPRFPPRPLGAGPRGWSHESPSTPTVSATWTTASVIWRRGAGNGRIGPELLDEDRPHPHHG